MLDTRLMWSWVGMLITEERDVTEQSGKLKEASDVCPQAPDPDMSHV